MNQKPKFEPFCSNHKAVSFQAMPSVLTFEMPIDEEIAKAIWQRQHYRLTSDAIFYNAKWRDPSVPSARSLLTIVAKTPKIALRALAA